MRSIARWCSLSVCLYFFLVSTAFAQKYIPKQIIFTGFTGASQKELLAASGLTAGAPLGQADIQAAAQKLSNTGLFSDIRFSFDGVALTYTLKPAPGEVPVSYANFPWWQSHALGQAVAVQVPLFHGLVIPESGLQDEITAALTALLKQKGIAATVSAIPVRGSGSGAVTEVEFRIESPAVQVGQVTFAGESPTWDTQLAAIVKAASGQDFGSSTDAQIEKAVEIVYHRQGYLDERLSRFSDGQPQVVAGKVLVPLSATITEGAQYRLTGLALKGDVLMSPADFAKNARIHAGDIADEDHLRQTLALVALPYKSKGYLDAAIRATPSFDHAQHTVSYVISVVPGPVYHMGKLTLLNLDPEQQELVTKYWTMRKGDVFDESYAPTFLNRNRNNLHALDSFSADYKQYANLDTHIVDLVITFRKGGPLN